MSTVERAIDSERDLGPVIPRTLQRLIVPALIAIVVAGAVLLAIVSGSVSAWQILGVGHGLVPPEYYHVSAFVVLLATMVGQAVGWAGGSAISYAVLITIGFPRGFFSWKLAMTIVYVGLGAFPLLFYHVLYGSPLLDLPRQGLEAWLFANHPDAHWLLIRLHPWVDGSVIPLGLIFLGFLWFTADAPRRSRLVQTVLSVAVVGTSLAVALSLGIHSALVHIRL
jgi:hypothetical protein